MEAIFLKSGINDVTIGYNVKVVQPVNLYKCEIGEQCFIGPFVEIQKNVRNGNKTRIQSHSFICELVAISDNCFIGHGVIFVNDIFSKGSHAYGDRLLWGHCTIGDNVSIGSNSTILSVSICENVVIGAGSVVTKDINEPGIYAGNPARLIRKGEW